MLGSRYFDAADCALMSSLPSTLSALTALRSLNLARNRLQGTVPLALSSLPLVHLDVSENYFRGSLDAFVGMTSLT